MSNEKIRDLGRDLPAEAWKIVNTLRERREEYIFQSHSYYGHVDAHKHKLEAKAMETAIDVVIGAYLNDPNFEGFEQLYEIDKEEVTSNSSHT